MDPELPLEVSQKEKETKKEREERQLFEYNLNIFHSTLSKMAKVFNESNIPEDENGSGNRPKRKKAE